MIPRIFHRLHLGLGKVHPQTLEWDKRLLELNPGWELRYWRPNDLPPMRNAALYELSANIGHRADIARYEVLYREGGVYLDWDMQPLQKMPDLNGIAAFAGCVRPFEYKQITINTEIAILGAKAGHPFFAYLLENLTPWAVQNMGHDPAIRTGPHYFHTMLEEWELANPDLTEDKGGVKRYPPPVFYPIIPRERGDVWQPHHGSIMIHHFWTTWLMGAGKMYVSEEKAREMLRKLLASSMPAMSSTATQTPTASRESLPA